MAKKRVSKLIEITEKEYDPNAHWGEDQYEKEQQLQKMKTKLSKTHYNGDGYDEISSPSKKHLDRKRASFVNQYIKSDNV